jgi:hypothetical protein
VNARLLILALVVLTPKAATAACCDLVKIDSDPPSTQVRACEPTASGACPTWLFEGSLAEGQSAPICATGDIVVYQEFDVATQSYAPPIKARCEDGGRVEL